VQQREVGERGEPGTEIVEREGQSEEIETRNHTQRLIDLEKRHSLGNLNDEPLWCKSARVSASSIIDTRFGSWN